VFSEATHIVSDRPTPVGFALSTCAQTRTFNLERRETGNPDSSAWGKLRRGKERVIHNCIEEPSCTSQHVAGIGDSAI
jgi:hypothetical protein